MLVGGEWPRGVIAAGKDFFIETLKVALKSPKKEQGSTLLLA